MRVVETWTELRENLIAFNSLRNSIDPLEREFYCERMRLGKCFVALEIEKGILFGPSNVVGKVENDESSYGPDNATQGWHTNPAIAAILGKLLVNNEVEVDYKQLCSELDIEPANNQRKYWFVRRDRDFLGTQ